MKIMLAKAEKRKHQHNKPTRFRVRGRELEIEKLKRFENRRFVRTEDKASPSAGANPCSHC